MPSEHDTDHSERPRPPSKSARKREFHSIQALARRLAGLPEARLAALPLGEAVAAALRAARPLERRARERQVRHAAGLLARDDWPRVAAALDALERPAREEVRAFHEIERWRDRLIAGDAALLEELARRLPGFDPAHARALARTAADAPAGGRAPPAARRLFRYLARCLEADSRT